MKEITERAKKIAEVIKKNDEVLVVTHIDADGITSGAIALESLKRCGIECDVEFVKNIDSDTISKIADKSTFVWFTDLGSGSLDLIFKSGVECVITDHHIPKGHYKLQLNPHEFGLDGAYEISGAGTTYLVAKELNPNHQDLITLSVVGAVGDLQDSKHCKLVGINRNLVYESVKRGLLDVVKDLRFFGKQTRPVYKMLEYTYDPFLPGISGNERGAVSFLEKLGIPIKIENWRRWIDLSRDEKRMIVSELVRLCVSCGYPVNTIKRLVGESYILLNQEEGTELRDAMEFSTLLNATARYGYYDIGLKVCLGVLDENDEFKAEFDKAYRKAKALLQNHRKNISNGLRIAENRIVELENIQYFHAKDEIIDRIVGIVAGMCYGKANLDKPIVAFAYTENGVKVSARATQRLVDKGVNLAQAIKIASEKVGGSGGGHRIASGAVIPRGKEDEFLRVFDRVVGEQIGCHRDSGR